MAFPLHRVDSPPVIQLENVTKTYPKASRPSLDDVSVGIEKGEFVFFIGPSGSGKSTLAAQLATKLGALVLDVDQIRQTIIPNSQQSQEDRDIAYRCMHLVAQKLLEAGANTVIPRPAATPR